jgi:lysophospholipase L1-like esterase
MRKKSKALKLQLIPLFFLVVLTACKVSEDNTTSSEVIASPKLSLIIPNTGAIGDLIKIIGENFGKVKEDITVHFGVKTAEVIDFSETLISCKAPALIGENLISVTVNKTTSNSLKFTYTDNGTNDEDFASKDKEKILSLLSQKEPINWVFTGNSITQGAKHTHGMRSYPEIFAERIRWELQRTTDFVINTGISGNNTLNILNDFDKRVSQFNPKVVVLMIGTNDADNNRNISVDQFGANLKAIIGKIRQIEAVPILLTPNIIIVEKSPGRNKLFEYVSKMKAIAQEEKVILVDNWNIWSVELQAKYNGEVFKYLLNDPLHPNGFGHQEIAMALFKELSIFDPVAPTCGGEYYEGYH